MDLAAWLERIERLHPVEIDLGLTRVAAVWAALDMPISGYVITVAGTNGKGSTVAALESAARAAGYSVGAYTSPHIIQYNERIRINGCDVSDEAICHAFKAIEQARGDISLSYFEFGTLAALVLFAEYQLDVVLLEVGLGGRMDAVNIIDANLAIVTSIALDHHDWLGSDLEFIAAEKSAVAREGRPLIIGQVPPLAYWDTLLQRQGATYFYGRDFSISNGCWLDCNGDGVDVQAAAIPLNSVAIAMMVTRVCPLWASKGNVDQAILQTRVAGRMQQIDWHGCPVLFDVAHNPASVALLASYLEQRGMRYRLIFAAMADKDLKEMLPLLLPYVQHVVLPQLNLARAAKPAFVQAMLPESIPSLCVGSMQEAVNALANDVDKSPILVAGSFFTVSEAMQCMGLEHVNKPQELSA